MNQPFARVFTTVGIALLVPGAIVAQVGVVESRRVEKVETARRPPPAARDPLAAARREAEAAKKGREANFAKIRGIGQPAPAAAFVQGQAEARVRAREQMIVAQNAQVEAQKKTMALQYATRLHPVLRAEYQFLRAVCAPSREQRQPIARAGLQAVRDAATDYVEWQYNPNRRVVRVVGTTRYVEQPDSRGVITKALSAAVAEHLTPEQRGRYEHELAERTAEQKRIALLVLMAKLDQGLVLSAGQRDSISASLSGHWDEGWSRGIESYGPEIPYYPLLPDEQILPFLNDAQKRVWAGVQKVMMNSFGFAGVQLMENGPLDDEFPDEDPADGPKPEEKK